MADDMYDDAADSAVAPSGPEPVADDESVEGEGATALLPKSFFPDEPEPGKVCTIRTVRVHDDQVEVEYVPEGEEEAAEEAPVAPPAAAGPSEPMME